MKRLTRSLDRWTLALFVALAIGQLVFGDWPDVPEPQSGPVLVTDRMVKP